MNTTPAPVDTAPVPVLAPLADPAATTPTTGATTLRYRVTADGTLVRLSPGR